MVSGFRFDDARSSYGFSRVHSSQRRIPNEYTSDDGPIVTPRPFFGAAMASGAMYRKVPDGPELETEGDPSSFAYRDRPKSKIRTIVVEANIGRFEIPHDKVGFVKVGHSVSNSYGDLMNSRDLVLFGGLVCALATKDVEWVASTRLLLPPSVETIL